MSTNCYERAVHLLSQREHSLFELKQKLERKGFSDVEINASLQQCQDEGYQSDDRYCELYVRQAMSKGYGPLRIVQSLKIKGVCTSLIQEHLDFDDDIWFEHAEQAWKKKFKPSKEPKEMAKQKRFLYHRGFESAIINKLINTRY